MYHYRNFIKKICKQSPSQIQCKIKIYKSLLLSEDLNFFTQYFLWFLVSFSCNFSLMYIFKILLLLKKQPKLNRISKSSGVWISRLENLLSLWMWFTWCKNSKYQKIKFKCMRKTRQRIWKILIFQSIKC